MLFKESINKRPVSLVKGNAQPTSTRQKEREEKTKKKQVLLSKRLVDVFPHSIRNTEKLQYRPYLPSTLLIIILNTPPRRTTSTHCLCELLVFHILQTQKIKRRDILHQLISLECSMLRLLLLLKFPLATPCVQARGIRYP